MLWSGVGGAIVRGFADAAGDTRHAELHLKKVKHHHHENGRYHVDESKSSFAHVTADASHANPAIHSPEVRFGPPRLGAPPPVHLSASLPSPYLPPLQRPPRPLT